MTTNFISMEMTGVARLTVAADQRTKGYGRGVARGVVKITELLLVESRKIVPIDEGDLHDTSHTRYKGRNFDKQGEVIYDQEYAAKQHEDLTYKHLPGKSVKYLEKPLRRLKSRMRKIVADEARQWRKS